MTYEDLVDLIDVGKPFSPLDSKGSLCVVCKRWIKPCNAGGRGFVFQAKSRLYIACGLFGCRAFYFIKPHLDPCSCGVLLFRSQSCMRCQ